MEIWISVQENEKIHQMNEKNEKEVHFPKLNTLVTLICSNSH